MKEITAFQCDYCTKHGKSKSHIKAHENKCFHNPKMRACATCANKEQVEYKKISDAPFTLGIEIAYYKPKCNEGFNLIQETEVGERVKYVHGCERWRAIEPPNEDDEYNL